ncbi:HNH endonuclease signature motif containing protein [Arenimonas oryziterrae]|uniref:HNH endonuclease signature motif containing protein n=1 Tax=Arenimonas oryziterrae TaxID=498055 RepID=UPI00316ADB4E
MWLQDLPAFAKQLAIPLNKARLRQCTAEHLLARCDGGGDLSENIVAACAFCNKQRHRRRQAPDPSAFKELVQRRIAAGRWLH